MIRRLRLKLRRMIDKTAETLFWWGFRFTISTAIALTVFFALMQTNPNQGHHEVFPQY